MWPFDAIIAFAQSNPLLVFMLCFMIYNKWKGSQPWPDFGGRITKVENLAAWNELLKANASKVTVVDAYALWCGPCKTAAPVYAKLSEQFSESTCCFAKVDVDHASDVARALGISAMPTFKSVPFGSGFFKDGKEVETQQGWCGEAKMKQLLEQHGAKLAVKEE